MLVGETLAHVKLANVQASKDVYELDAYISTSKPNAGQDEFAVAARWLSPEALLDQVFSHKSDVWAFGIFVYEVYTYGRLPYGLMTVKELIQEVCHAGYRLPLPMECPVRIYDLVLQCLVRNPMYRPSFADLKAEFTIINLADADDIFKVNLAGIDNCAGELTCIAVLPVVYTVYICAYPLFSVSLSIILFSHHLYCIFPDIFLQI